jgi:hypothetical protein
MSSTLEIINDGNWRGFMNAPASVLVLAISSCQACSEWRSELEDALAKRLFSPETRFGVIVLDSADTGDFKQENLWLDEVPGIPFTAIFQYGEPQTSFAGGGRARLERRLEGLGLSKAVDSAA